MTGADKAAVAAALVEHGAVLRATIAKQASATVLRFETPDDLFQGFATEALARAERFDDRGEGSARAWLFEVARNQALSALRARTRLPRPVSSLATDEEQKDLLDLLPDEQVNRPLEEQEFMDAFGEAVEELPEHYQTVFDLCVRQGKPYQEAAEILGIPTGTVAIRIMRARKRLFGTLSRHLGRLRRPPACFQ